MWAVTFVIGLTAGSAIGVLLSVKYIVPAATEGLILAINPVQVSGAVTRIGQMGGIQFVNENETQSTRYNHRADVINGNYTILLSGGYFYDVYISSPGLTGALATYTVYIPSNVTTLTLNFTA